MWRIDGWEKGCTKGRGGGGQWGSKSIQGRIHGAHSTYILYRTVRSSPFCSETLAARGSSC